MRQPAAIVPLRSGMTLAEAVRLFVQGQSGGQVENQKP